MCAGVGVSVCLRAWVFECVRQQKMEFEKAATLNIQNISWMP